MSGFSEFKTLESLRLEAKRLKKEGSDHDDILQLFYEVLAPLKIRIRCDVTLVKTEPEPVAPPRLVNKQHPGKKSTHRGKPEPKKPQREIRMSVERGVLQVVDVEEEDDLEVYTGGVALPEIKQVRRVILSYTNSFGGLLHPICAECNGVVLDAETWEYLAVPPREFNYRAPEAAVDVFLAKGLYDIIQVSDATVVTLYKHPARKDAWCISSSNGYDVSSFRWMGGKTFAEVIYELLGAYVAFAAETQMGLVRVAGGDETDLGGDSAPKKTAETFLTFKKLDPACSYTIGVRHHNYHPLLHDPPGAWNIRATRLSDQTVAAGLKGIPAQKVYTAAEIHTMRGAGGSTEPVTQRILKGLLEGALADAKTEIAKDPHRTAPVDPDATVRVTPFAYGFVLRSRAPKATGVFSDVLVQSDLLLRVQSLVYRRHQTEIRSLLDHGNRLEYNALRAYLTPLRRRDFVELFPRLQPRYKAYAALIQDIVRRVVAAQRAAVMTPGAKPGAPATHADIIAREILAYIRHRENGTFRVFDPDAAKIVTDFVVQPDYAHLYLAALAEP